MKGDSEITLGARNISKRFNSVRVLNDISLEFESGTVTAIVGDNGAGKSTLLKILSGYYQPDMGELFLGETALSGSSTHAHRKVGVEMVYQELALAKNHDVAANLFFGRELATPFGFLKKRKMFSEAGRILSELGIEIPNMKNKVGNFSGGQQQAVSIARAILFDPKVLLLDEPTAALAAREVQLVLELIQRQKELGRIIVLVSHRLNDVFSVADRIVVLKRGQVYSDDHCSKVTLAEVVQRIVS